MAVRDDDDERDVAAPLTGVQAAAAAAATAASLRAEQAASKRAEDFVGDPQAGTVGNELYDTVAPLDAGEAARSNIIPDTEPAIAPETDTEGTVHPVDFADIRLEAGWVIEPPRPAYERIRTWCAAAAAIFVHAVAIAMTSANPVDDRIGAGGQDLESISVEIVPWTDLTRASRATPTETAGAAPLRPDPRPGQGEESRESLAEARSVDASATTKVPPASQKRAAIEIPLVKPEAGPAELTIGKRKSETSGVADDAPDLDAESKAPRAEDAAGPEADDQPQLRPESPSAAATPSTESVARTEGGSDGIPPVEAKQPGSTGVELAAGRRAVAYGAEVVKALASLQQHLQRMNNDRDVRSRGKVELMLTIDGDGRPELIRILSSSGDASLDRLAIADVNGFRFPPAPADLPVGLRTYRLPITYR